MIHHLVRRDQLLTLLLPLYLCFSICLFAQDDQLPGPDTENWSCGRKIDPSYITITEGSGGQLLLLDPSETSKSTVLMEAQLKGIEETIFRIGGKISGTKEYVVPVDSTVEKLTFSVFVQCIDKIHILFPDGSELAPHQGGPEDFVFHAGRVVTIPSPVTGDWKIRVSGQGFHSVQAIAKTSIGLDDFDFVQPGGRPGHEGLFPMEGMPVSGTRQQVRLALSGEIRDVDVSLISSTGEFLQKVEIEPVSDPETDPELLGTIRVPKQTFRVVVRGKDIKGNPIQRVDPPLYHPAAAPK